MIDDIEMLESLTATADMGISALQQAVDATSDKKLTNVLKSQIRDYQKNYDSAYHMLKQHGKTPQNAPMMAKAQAKVMTSLKTIVADDPTSKIAEMVIEGSTMGVTKITQRLHDYSGQNPVITSLAENQVKTEQANIEQMKQFL